MTLVGGSWQPFWLPFHESLIRQRSKHLVDNHICCQVWPIMVLHNHVPPACKHFHPRSRHGCVNEVSFPDSRPKHWPIPIDCSAEFCNFIWPDGFETGMPCFPHGRPSLLRLPDQTLSVSLPIDTRITWVVVIRSSSLSSPPQDLVLSCDSCSCRAHFLQHSRTPCQPMSSSSLWVIPDYSSAEHVPVRTRHKIEMLNALRLPASLSQHRRRIMWKR